MPIGDNSKQFKGTFTSSNFNTISNLYINRSSRQYTGLFGYIGSGGKVGGFNLINTTVTGANHTGGVAGYNYGTISSMNIEDLYILGNGYVGGIAGQSSKTIQEIVVRGRVTGTSAYVGGVVGYNGATGNTGYIYNTLANVNVAGASGVGGVVGSSYSSGLYNPVRAIIEGGTISGSSRVGEVSGYYEYTGLVYISNKIEKIGTGGFDGNRYDSSYHSISMYDDILDTIYGGDNDGSGFYFDYENDESDKIVLKKVEEHSFDTTIRGEGTESKPYILASEKDFKDVAIIGKGDYYYKIYNNLDISSFRHFYPLGTTNNYFSGYLDGNEKIISNMNLNGGQYGGFIGYLNGGSVKDLTINNSTISGRYGANSRTGLLIGTAAEGTKAIGINLNNDTVIGTTNIGGVVGYNLGTMLAMNIEGISVTGTGYVGGVVGWNYTGTIQEVVVRGSVEGANDVGGIAGHTGGSTYFYYGYIYNTLANVNVTGNSRVGGAVGGSYTSGPSNPIRAVIEGGNVSGSSSVGKVSGQYDYSGLVYVSASVTKTGTGIFDGTPYSSEYIGDLSYYGSIKYTSNKIEYPLLESRLTGDVNGSGWWFDYNSKGDIIVVKVSGSTGTPPESGGGEGDGKGILLTELGTVTGTCPDDVTPPTCTFYRFGAVINGIKAEFSCTDDKSVPEVASMFNSVVSTEYTFEQITDPSRGGTIKTGIVDEANKTRHIISTWTTAYEGKKPEPGKCYYYQFAARDACGNERDYVTTDCYYGFKVE